MNSKDKMGNSVQSPFNTKNNFKAYIMPANNGKLVSSVLKRRK
jgi:hypothetical protein